MEKEKSRQLNYFMLKNSNMQTLRDLFELQLQDLHSAEAQLVDTLPIMANMANNKVLRGVFKEHLKETKIQKSRIETICRQLNLSPMGKNSTVVEQLIGEIKIFLSQVEEEEIMDIGLIAEAQRFEHYEISTYETAVRYAKELGLREVARQLQETLNEEYDANCALAKIAENRLDKAAIKQV